MPSKKAQAILKKIKRVGLKGQRIYALSSFGDFLDWNSLAIADVKTLHSDNRIKSELLSILKRQKKSAEQLRLELATVLADLVKQKILVALSEDFHERIRRSYEELKRIESIPSAGGRKRNRIVWKTAKDEYENWIHIKGRAPSGTKLSNLVEAKLLKLLGQGRSDGNLYLPPRSATVIIKQLKEVKKSA